MPKYQVDVRGPDNTDVTRLTVDTDIAPAPLASVVASENSANDQPTFTNSPTRRPAENTRDLNNIELLKWKKNSKAAAETEAKNRERGVADRHHSDMVNAKSAAVEKARANGVVAGEATDAAAVAENAAKAAEATASLAENAAKMEQVKAEQAAKYPDTAKSRGNNPDNIKKEAERLKVEASEASAQAQELRRQANAAKLEAQALTQQHSISKMKADLAAAQLNLAALKLAEIDATQKKVASKRKAVAAPPASSEKQTLNGLFRDDAKALEAIQKQAAQETRKVQELTKAISGNGAGIVNMSGLSLGGHRKHHTRKHGKHSKHSKHSKHTKKDNQSKKRK
jgi:colicin import membrane protein